eukprot:5418991-Alexandrium_andersonii.AAC.1
MLSGVVQSSSEVSGAQANDARLILRRPLRARMSTSSWTKCRALAQALHADTDADADTCLLYTSPSPRD